MPYFLKWVLYIIMAKKLLIIGNGFDIDLGLRTRYSDFAKSNPLAELI